MSWIELEDYLSDVAMLEYGFTDKMKRSLMNLQSFFNNKYGEFFNTRDIKRYIELNCEMNIRIGIKNRINGDGFEGGDEHKLNYAIKVVKKYYEDSESETKRQMKKEFQEKVVKPTMGEMTDDEFLAMIQEQDAFNNLSESETEIQTNDKDNIKSKNVNDNELYARLEIIKTQTSEEFNKVLSELETRLSNRLLGIETLLSLDGEQSTVNKPKRRGRPRKKERLMKCICCGEDKRADEAKKGIENDFYKSHSKIHLGCNGFIPICKDCLENIYDNLESELTAAIKKAGIDVAEYYTERKVIERICLMNDIYYNDSLFDAALKHSSNNTMVSAYMKIANLIQYKKKTYEDSFKERMKEEILGMKEEQRVDLSWMEDVV